MDESLEERIDQKFGSGYGKRGFRNLMIKYITGWAGIALFCGVLEFVLFLFAGFYNMRHLFGSVPFMETVCLIILLLAPVGLFAYFSYKRWDKYKKLGLPLSAPLSLFLCGLMTVLFVIFIILSAAARAIFFAVLAMRKAAGPS